MSFKRANKHSTKRSPRGIKRRFADPESLWAACSEYFKWVAANPVQRSEPLAQGGEVAVKATPRVASQRQLCRFLDVGKTTWHRYRQNQRFAEVINRVEATVRTQNADAAAVRLCAKKPPGKGSRCGASAVEGQSPPNAEAPPVEASHRRREFKKGNQLWRKRSSHGPAPKFSDPESLWAACLEYFDWAFDTPLEQDKIFNVKGELKHEPLERMRAMTIHGLCIFIDISTSTWNRHRNREGFTEVTDRVESIIRTQKFEGAAADLLNSKIISRDLKLGEREQAALDEQRKAKVQSDADDVTRKLLPEAFAGDEENAA
jgi:hypothetical protein